VRRYFTRKIITYVVAFFLATTIDWAIPRVMPGNPVQLYLTKFSITTEAQYARCKN
jgi:peptide/nickel transport system permease protein